MSCVPARISALAAAVLAVGCATADEPHTGAAAQYFATCDGWLCGTNSPQIAELGFWELNAPPVLGTPGLGNNKGIQLHAFLQGSTTYLPRVHQGRLTATSGGTTLSGPALVGGSLVLFAGLRVFKISIHAVGSVASWAQPPGGGPTVMLESYQLDWSELVKGNWGDERSLCPHPPTRESGDGLTMTGPYAFHTLLFEGDRIDPEHKLDTAVDNSWFNLGCAGSALAKMALTGHTEAAHNANTFHTTLSERQTMLKLLAADYCGTGLPFTVPGQPLNWQDDHGTMKLTALLAMPPQPLAREARWNEKGAACLDKPRIDAHPTPLGTSTFGADVYDQVVTLCGPKMPPPCAGVSLGNAGYHLLSATP
jgi:hypothetical protein